VADDYGQRLREDIERDVHDRIQRKMDRLEGKLRRRRERREHHHSPAAGIVFGTIVVLVGLGFLLDNMGIIDFREFWKFWPVILIAYGVSRIFSCRAVTSVIWGGAVALIGALLLLNNLDILFFRFDYIWPLIIIAFGLSLLARAVERKRYLAGESGAPVSSENILNIVAVFSGANRVIDSPDFRGGDIVAVFGGVRLDLRRAAMTLDRVVVDVSAVFGGVEIRVPENWSVSTKGVGIFGGFDDKTLHPKPDPNGQIRELVLTGAAVFGGTSVSN
jgi:predicted membrane protein